MPIFAGELKRAIYFQQCKQITCDRNLLKSASFESARAGHLIRIQKNMPTHSLVVARATRTSHYPPLPGPMLRVLLGRTPIMSGETI